MGRKKLQSNRRSFDKLKAHLREKHVHIKSVSPEIKIVKTDYKDWFQAKCGCGDASEAERSWAALGRWAQQHRDETGHQLSKRGQK